MDTFTDFIEVYSSTHSFSTTNLFIFLNKQPFLAHRVFILQSILKDYKKSNSIFFFKNIEPIFYIKHKEGLFSFNNITEVLKSNLLDVRTKMFLLEINSFPKDISREDFLTQEIQIFLNLIKI
ncbi:MAG: hypothetical protein ACRC4M_04660 [Mycoplasma sp.]